MEAEFLNKVLAEHDYNKKAIISIMHEIQGNYYYLPEDSLQYMSKSLDVPISWIYNMATFYKAFSLVPKGKNLIQICTGTACHVRGSIQLLEKLERELDIKEGETTKDLLFSLTEVHCLGCCGIAPVITIGEDVNGKMSVTRIAGILKRFKSKEKANIEKSVVESSQ